MVKTSEDDDSKFKAWRGKKVNAFKLNQIICLYVAGQSTSQIAKEIGVSTRTIERYFHNEEFQHTMTSAIKLTFRQAILDASLYARRAIERLFDIIEDETQPVKYQLEAIGMLLSVCHKTQLEKITEEVANTMEGDLFKQNRLMSGMFSVKALMEDNKMHPEISQVIHERNQRTFWKEFYPNEPFPKDYHDEPFLED